MKMNIPKYIAEESGLTDVRDKIECTHCGDRKCCEVYAFMEEKETGDISLYLAFRCPKYKIAWFEERTLLDVFTHMLIDGEETWNSMTSKLPDKPNEE